jgi:hypothetical protein
MFTCDGIVFGHNLKLRACLGMKELVIAISGLFFG